MLEEVGNRKRLCVAVGTVFMCVVCVCVNVGNLVVDCP